MSNKVFVANADMNLDSGTITVTQAQYVGNIHSENVQSHEDPKRGFSDTREFQLIARIPLATYYAERFHRFPPDERHARLERFINVHPECRTVDKLLHVNANAGHVVVK